MLTPRIKYALSSPSASFRLKTMIGLLLDADCVDAIHEADHLASLFGERARIILGLPMAERDAACHHAIAVKEAIAKGGGS